MVEKVKIDFLVGMGMMNYMEEPALINFMEEQGMTNYMEIVVMII